MSLDPVTCSRGGLGSYVSCRDPPLWVYREGGHQGPRRGQLIWFEKMVFDSNVGDGDWGAQDWRQRHGFGAVAVI